MPTGIDNLPKRQGGNSFVKVQDDGEMCRIRFLTDGDAFVSDYFHRVMQGKQFKGWSLCQGSLGKDCEPCEDGDNAQLQFLAHVFEYEHYFVEAGQNRKKTRVGNRTYYVEEVNEARLMRYAAAHLASIRLRWERNGTLLDRDFEWIRSGAKGDTRPSYTLEPLEPTKLSKAIKEVSVDLTDLEEIALASSQKAAPKTRRLREDDDDDEAEVKTSRSRRAKVEEDDEDEDDDPPF